MSGGIPPGALRGERSPEVCVNQAAVTCSFVLGAGNSRRRMYGLGASTCHRARGGIVLGRQPPPPVPTAWDLSPRHLLQCHMRHFLWGTKHCECRPLGAGSHAQCPCGRTRLGPQRCAARGSVGCSRSPLAPHPQAGARQGAEPGQWPLQRGRCSGYLVALPGPSQPTR